MFVKSTLKPATIRFIGKVRGKDCSGGGHKARRSEAFLHTKKMFYDILGSLGGQMFFLKNTSEGMSASGTAESLFFAERKKPPE